MVWLWNKAPALNQDGYFFDDEDLSFLQRRFLDKLNKSLRAGHAIDVGEEYGYLYLFVYECIEKDNLLTAIELMKTVVENYSHFNDLTLNCRYWISDCYVLLGDISSALEHHPRPTLGSRATATAQSSMSLKHGVF